MFVLLLFDRSYIPNSLQKATHATGTQLTESAREHRIALHKSDQFIR